MSNLSSDVVQRFLKYVQIHTTSAEDVDNIPSTDRQFTLAKLLVDELRTLGLSDAAVDNHCIVLGTLPGNLPPNQLNKTPTIAFIAHLDTSPQEPGENVHPRILEKYSGGDITFPNNSDLRITPAEVPALKKYIGVDFITSDGTTLLGVDDKAGIAIIMAAIAQLVANPSKLHGNIKILFTPDEEVGHGMHAVDVTKLGATYAFTIDGGEMGEFEIETFNAYNGTITIHGYNVHPGEAFGKMINAVRIAGELLAYFPHTEAPETTKEKQGYYHPLSIEGDANLAKIKFLLRDFDPSTIQKRIQHIQAAVREVEKKYPKCKIELDLKEMYRNMAEVLNKHPKVIQIGEKAIKMAGIPVIRRAIRGGTDGAMLSFKGIPTPNLFTGGHNFHSKKELIPIPALYKGVEVVLNIIELAQKELGTT